MRYAFATSMLLRPRLQPQALSFLPLSIRAFSSAALPRDVQDIHEQIILGLPKKYAAPLARIYGMLKREETQLPFVGRHIEGANFPDEAKKSLYDLSNRKKFSPESLRALPDRAELEDILPGTAKRFNGGTHSRSQAKAEPKRDTNREESDRAREEAQRAREKAHREREEYERAREKANREREEFERAQRKEQFLQKEADRLRQDGHVVYRNQLQHDRYNIDLPPDINIISFNEDGKMYLHTKYFPDFTRLQATVIAECDQALVLQLLRGEKSPKEISENLSTNTKIQLFWGGRGGMGLMDQRSSQRIRFIDPKTEADIEKHLALAKTKTFVQREKPRANAEEAGFSPFIFMQTVLDKGKAVFDTKHPQSSDQEHSLILLLAAMGWPGLDQLNIVKEGTNVTYSATSPQAKISMGFKLDTLRDTIMEDWEPSRDGQRFSKRAPDPDNGYALYRQMANIAGISEQFREDGGIFTITSKAAFRRFTESINGKEQDKSSGMSR